MLHTTIMTIYFFINFSLTSSSAFVKQLVEELDLFELECKLDMFRVRERCNLFVVVLFVFLFVYFINKSDRHGWPNLRIAERDIILAFDTLPAVSRELQHTKRNDCFVIYAL